MPSSDTAWIGRVIGGKYRVEALLGRGGMGVVLKARHLRIDEPVAIKILHATLMGDPDMSARMMREARATLRLSSEHVVRVMDVDALDDGIPYLVLEYLEGTDVATLLRRSGGKLSPEEAIPIALQACRGLTEAHAHGVIHRDLKPANLFLVTRPDGRRVVKLVDFGVSKSNDGRDAPITRKGDIIGSPRYMAPEQVRGEALDGRADIWSMGVVLYEILSGKSPFETNNFARTCQRVLAAQHERLDAVCPELPPALVAVVERCLEKERDRRFPDAAALADALATFGPASVRMPAPSSVPEPPPSQQGPSSAPQSIPQSTSAPATPASQRWLPPTGSFALAADVDDEKTRIARPKSRAFLWIALASLLVGLAAGIATLTQSSAPAPAAATGAAPTSPEPTQAPQAVTTATASASTTSALPPSGNHSTDRIQGPAEAEPSRETPSKTPPPSSKGGAARR